MDGPSPSPNVATSRCGKGQMVGPAVPLLVCRTSRESTRGTVTTGSETVLDCSLGNVESVGLGFGMDVSLPLV